MIAAVAAHILALPPWLALLVVFALPALESSAFVGFVFPGEVALVLGGVMAYQGRVPLVAVLAAAIAGCVAGDSVGYAVGRRYGRRLLDGTVGRFVRRRHLDRAETYLAERGGPAVFFGRFTATLRVLVPGLAGMSGMRYRTFLTYNVASALGWGTLSVMLGYLGGSSWRHVEHVASRVGLGALAAVVVLVGGGLLLRRGVRRRRDGRAGEPVDQHGRHQVETTPEGRAPRAAQATPHPEARVAPSGPATPVGDPPRVPRVLVVVPTYNESGTVVTLLDRVLDAVPSADVLVVDDGSPDGTADLVTAHRAYHRDGTGGGAGRVLLLSRTAKDGLGAAYRAGFAWAAANGYEHVVQMDADLSHPADRIPVLLAALATADVAVGSRYVPGGSVGNWPVRRRLVSSAGNRYVRLVLSLPVHDTTSGFKAFRRDALTRIGAVSTTSNGYCFQVENTWRAARLGLRVTEVPITFTDRTLGASKMSAAIVVEAVVRVLGWRWRELTHRTGGRLPAANRHAAA